MYQYVIYNSMFSTVKDDTEYHQHTFMTALLTMPIVCNKQPKKPQVLHKTTGKSNHFGGSDAF